MVVCFRRTNRLHRLQKCPSRRRCYVHCPSFCSDLPNIESIQQQATPQRKAPAHGSSRHSRLPWCSLLPSSGLGLGRADVCLERLQDYWSVRWLRFADYLLLLLVVETRRRGPHSPANTPEAVYCHGVRHPFCNWIGYEHCTFLEAPCVAPSPPPPNIQRAKLIT